MPVIHFGTGSEYVKISLPPSFATEAWLQVDVEIAVCGFQGRIEPWVEPTDIEAFSKQLRALYDYLQGEATFCPRDRQFTIKLVCLPGGQIEVTGEAWSKATYENKLEYALQLDQSFLVAPLRELEGFRAAAGNSVG